MADRLQAGFRFGRIEIRRAIRRDGVGVEYEASVSGRNTPAIVKEYFPEGLAERREGGGVRARSPAAKALFDAGLARFLAQHRTLAQLDQPAVVKVRECLNANGTGYAVMDRPEGIALEARLESQDRLPEAELARIFDPILEGLEAVHRAGLVHRGINPRNIVIQRNGSPMLCGFGAAPSAASGPRQAFSPPSSSFPALLTPGYAALEQYSTKGQEGPWTDIYALAAVMYRCVTGTAPADALGRAVRDDLIPASRAAPGSVDRQTLAGIDAALALRVAERPHSLDTWRRQLRSMEPRERRATAAGAPMGARQIQPRGTVSRAATQRSTTVPRPAVSARPTIRGARAAPNTGASRTAQRGPSWAVPALAALVFIALLTWLDTGVLRSADKRADAGQAVVLEGSGSEPANTADAPLEAAEDQRRPARIEIDPSVEAGQRSGGRERGVAPTTPRLVDKATPVDVPATERLVTPETGIDIAAPTVAPLPGAAGEADRARPTDRPDDKAEATPPGSFLPVSIVTEPAGARVIFTEDGHSYSPEMRLPPGHDPLTVTLPGYERWEGVVAHGAPSRHHRVTLKRLAAEFVDRLSSGASGPIMVPVPPGVFQVGCVSGKDCFDNEFPLRNVEIDRPFALSKYEITQQDYDRFTHAAARRPARSPTGPERGAWPVVAVAWDDAAAYTAWLASETGRNYRLPNEAEWEYAARSLTATPYSWGNDAGSGRANCTGCGSLPAHRAVSPVGSFAANPWGLHDMHGNVWEWVADCPDRRRPADSPIDGELSAAKCVNRVRRSGSWAHSPRRMRSASRTVTNAQLRSLDTGFRVLLQIE